MQNNQFALSEQCDCIHSLMQWMHANLSNCVSNCTNKPYWDRLIMSAEARGDSPHPVKTSPGVRRSLTFATAPAVLYLFWSSFTKASKRRSAFRASLSPSQTTDVELWTLDLLAGQDKNINDETALAEGIMNTVSCWQESHWLPCERVQLGVLASWFSGRIMCYWTPACLLCWSVVS